MENLNILYEDNHIIVVIKPQNVPTQEDESKDADMLTMVKDYIKEKASTFNEDWYDAFKTVLDKLIDVFKL